MSKIKKIVIFSVFVHTLSFGMIAEDGLSYVYTAMYQGTAKQTMWNAARKRAFDRMRENLKTERKNVKFLEHSCFKGECLQFQSEFFLSNYTNLPQRQLDIHSMILGPQVKIADNPLFGVFQYHARYRKDCSRILETFGKHVQTNITANAIYLGQLMADPMVSIVYRTAVQLSQMNSTVRIATILGAMSDAFVRNDYQMVIRILMNYQEQEAGFI